MSCLIDGFGRRINYLRVSVTDRCNLRCVYCMPQGGVAYKEPSGILTFEEILRVVKISSSLGIDKIRLTGGEPFVRRNLMFLIESILEIPGIKDFSLTTNGVLLKDYAHKLKSAGVKRINISLDTLDADKFKRIARGDYFLKVIRGIEAAIDAGLLVKLNMVVMRGINDGEVMDFVHFCQEKKITLRFIEFMPVRRDFLEGLPEYVANRDIRNMLEKLGRLMPIGGFSHHPAVYYRIAGFSQELGFISPMSEKFCAKCNRLRLSSDGALLPCLGGSIKIDLKTALRKKAKDEEIVRLIHRAVSERPKEHCFGNLERFSSLLMSGVGG